MRPRRFYCKGNDGTEAPTSFLFFDTESWIKKSGPNGQHEDYTLRLWTSCYVRREGLEWREPVWHQGETDREFWSVVHQYINWSRPLWAFAHSLGHDLTQLKFWDQLQQKQFYVGPTKAYTIPGTGKKRRAWRGLMVLEDRPCFLIVRSCHGTLKLVDTVNYWPEKLAKLGKRLGYPKLKVNFTKCKQEELFTYCRRDTEITKAAVCDLVTWWLKEDCGTFAQTAPMLSMNNWRHTTDQVADKPGNTMVVFEEGSPARKPERKAAYGGWVEPFFVGHYRGRLYHYDCNSLYGYIMRDGLFPRARVKSPGACNLSDLRAWVEAYGCVALVLLDTGRSGETYPCRINTVQVHATGKFTTWLCGEELRRAVRLDHVREVFDCHVYSVAPLFRSWCDTWLERKQQATADQDEGRLEFIKLILNSLNGKWSQRGDVWRDTDQGPKRQGFGHTIDRDAETGEMTQWRWIAGNTQKKEPGFEPVRAFPAIYGFITARAREFMKSVFARMPARSVLYTATDSIICTPEGRSALRDAGLLDPCEPGKFKLMGRSDDCEIIGPNWYRFGPNYIIGGHFGRAKLGRDGKYRCRVWQRMASLIQTNPNGVCSSTVRTLAHMKSVVKNDPDEHGWRRPYRYTDIDGMTDPKPHLPAPIFRES